MGLSRTGSFGSLILWPSTVKIPPQQRVNDDLTPLIQFHILLRLLIRIITLFTVVGILQVLHFAAIRRHNASATSFAPSCFLRRGGKGGNGGLEGEEFWGPVPSSIEIPILGGIPSSSPMRGAAQPPPHGASNLNDSLGENQVLVG